MGIADTGESYDILHIFGSALGQPANMCRVRSAPVPRAERGHRKAWDSYIRWLPSQPGPTMSDCMALEHNFAVAENSKRILSNNFEFAEAAPRAPRNISGTLTTGTLAATFAVVGLAVFTSGYGHCCGPSRPTARSWLYIPTGASG